MFMVIHMSGKKSLPSRARKQASRGNCESSGFHTGQWEGISAERTFNRDLFSGVGIEPSTLAMSGKYTTTELHSQPPEIVSQYAAQPDLEFAL